MNAYLPIVNKLHSMGVDPASYMCLPLTNRINVIVIVMTVSFFRRCEHRWMVVVAIKMAFQVVVIAVVIDLVVGGLTGEAGEK